MIAAITTKVATDTSGALVAKFLAAQDRVYPQVLGELRAGRKTSHWMWFIFPQLAGLGTSEVARTYSLADLSEARAFAAQEIAHAGLALGAAITEGVDPFAFGSWAHGRLRLLHRSLSHRLLFDLGADARLFSSHDDK